MEILVTHRVNHVLPESGVRLLLQRPFNVKRVRLAESVPTRLLNVKIVQQVHIKMKQSAHTGNVKIVNPESTRLVQLSDVNHAKLEDINQMCT
jgi:hypothetical protein